MPLEFASYEFPADCGKKKSKKLFFFSFNDIVILIDEAILKVQPCYLRCIKAFGEWLNACFLRFNVENGYFFKIKLIFFKIQR